MNEVEVGVLSEQVKNLDKRIEKGLEDIKELIRNSTNNLNEHIKENKDKFAQVDEEIHNLKIEMAKFKERWLLIGGAISIFGSTIIQLISHVLK
jgi:ribosome recycling factor